MWILLGFIILILGFYIFIIFPSPVKKEEFKRFARRSYAHRGLYDNNAECPENSLIAFSSAAENGYGIELDLQMTNDGKLVVFHDADFFRAAEIKQCVSAMNFDEIRKIKIFGSSETTPLFSEVLNIVNERVPLILEIKSDPKRTNEICNCVCKELLNYNGDYCIESFDPFVLRWFRKNASDIVRGQLSMGKKGYLSEITSVKAFLASNLLINSISRPNFVAYRHQDRGFGFFVSKLLGAKTVMWTVDDINEQLKLQKTEDAIIFEGFLPIAEW